MRPHPIGLPEQVHWIGGVVVVKSGRGSHTLVVLVLVLVLALVPTCYITCVACFVLVSSKQASNWFSLCFSLSVTYPKKCRPAGKKEKKERGPFFLSLERPRGRGERGGLLFLSSFSLLSLFFLFFFLFLLVLSGFWIRWFGLHLHLIPHSRGAWMCR